MVLVVLVVLVEFVGELVVLVVELVVLAVFVVEELVTAGGELVAGGGVSEYERISTDRKSAPDVTAIPSRYFSRSPSN